MRESPFAHLLMPTTEVVFRTPWIQRCFDMAFVVMVTLAGTALGTIFVMLALLRALPRSWSLYQVLLMSALMAMVVTAFIVLVARARPTRIILDEQGVRARGLLYRRELRYEDLALVAVNRPKNSVGRASRVCVRPKRGRPMSIWLSSSDVAECFESLRRLCEHVPAIDVEGSVLAPESPLHRREGLLAAAEKFRRRAVRQAILFALLIVFSIPAITSLVSFYSGGAPTSSRSITRRWLSAILLPLGAAGAAAAWHSHRRFARQLQHDADNGGWTVGFAEDEDEDAIG